MNTPSGQLSSKLGVYNTVFGAGWMADPIAARFASDEFGSGSPYLVFSIIGGIFVSAITILRKGNNHF